MHTRTLEADLIIVGGGAAGCYAAVRATELALEKKRHAPSIVILEKAHIERSGCLAAGVNAINAYIGQGRSPEDYVKYAMKDAHGIARRDLLLSMAERLNPVVARLEAMGLVILKDAHGRYAERGWRNIKINGENIKPVLASAVRRLPNVTVLNRTYAASYLTHDGAVCGVTAFGVTEPVQTIATAPAVLCATGGASGLYRPRNPGFSRHKTWYCPFNTGAGYAMGILAGAEMTTLEMRFVALRCKDTIAPTGTLAQGAGAKQVNSHGEVYESRYGLTTSQRAYGTLIENLEGRGPCRLVADVAYGADANKAQDLLKAYLNMAPSQTLKWLENTDDGAFIGLNDQSEAGASRTGGTRTMETEIEGSEPYIVGGHTASGYWVDETRATTLPGLYAAGDVAGGCPQKYVSGAMAEAEIAVLHALNGQGGLNGAMQEAVYEQARAARHEADMFFQRAPGLFAPSDLEDAMQKCMDVWAGGIGADYAYNAAQLDRARDRIAELEAMSAALSAQEPRELLKIYELRERLVVCRSLIAHLQAREETRWPGFARNQDHPQRDEAWLRFVNSRLENGSIRIIYRDLVPEGACHEHYH